MSTIDADTVSEIAALRKLKENAAAAGSGQRLPAVLSRVIFIALLLALWEMIPRLGIVTPIILPPLSQVVRAAAGDPVAFLDGLRITVLEALVAAAIAWALGIGLGLVVGASVRGRNFVVPLLESAFAIPWVLLYPLVVVWLGIGPTSKVAYAAVFASFTIMLTTIAAVSTVDPKTLLLARALGASRVQVFTKVLFPFALPQIISGLRVGTGLAIIGVLGGEMLLSLGGLGYMITYYRTLFESGYVYMAIVLGVLLTVVANQSIAWLERRVAWWHATSR